LILIGHIDPLPRIFQRVILPAAVKQELHDIDAPGAVRAWIGSPPAWLEIVETPAPGPTTLDGGEAAVIALAISLHADLVLIDERRASKLRETTDYASPALWACSKSPRNPGSSTSLRRHGDCG
jgi:predicted nucleic acid-binding protein